MILHPTVAVILTGTIFFISFIVCQPALSSNPCTTSSSNARLGLTIICLGPYGGIDQSALNSYLIKGLPVANEGNCKPSDIYPLYHDDGFVNVDAGSTFTSLSKAIEMGAFEGLLPPPSTYSSTNLTPLGYIYREAIKGFVISHPHYDHVSGLLISSTEATINSLRPLFGSQFTIDAFKKLSFNWISWPNFGDNNENALRAFKYEEVEEDGLTRYKIPNTSITFSAFKLHHGDYPSSEGTLLPYPNTAFLLEYKPTSDSSKSRESSRSIHDDDTSRTDDLLALEGAKMLYVGDTGSDVIQKSTNLYRLWKAMAPHIVNQSLRAIILECSYSDDRPQELLFGHLTPQLFAQEMSVLKKCVNDLVASPAQLNCENIDDGRTDAVCSSNSKNVQSKNNVDPFQGNSDRLMNQVKVIVSGIKPESLIYRQEKSSVEQIKSELEYWNKKMNLNLDLKFMEPGERLDVG